MVLLKLPESDPLQGTGNDDICCLFLKSWLGLLNDSPLRRGEKPKKDALALLKRVQACGLQESIRFYSDLGHKLMLASDLMSHTFPQGEWIPEMAYTPLMREYHAWYRTGEPKLFQWLVSICNFGKKLDLDDPKLEQAAFRGWFAVEDRLRDQKLDLEALRGLKTIMSCLIGSHDSCPSEFHFGPGTVAEGGIWGSVQKTSILGTHPRLERAFYQPNPFNKDGCLSGAQFAEAVRTAVVDGSLISRDDSKLSMVKKDQSKYRTICQEPNDFMFAQQGTRIWLNHLIDTGEAKRFVTIEDQSRNRALACYGSETGTLDTIDLKDSSDSVSIDLVRGVFPRFVLYYMLASRTDTVFTPVGPVRVKKFAPMGSAVCFPTQCLIFTAVCIYAAICHRSGYPVGSILPSKYVTKDSALAAINSFADNVGRYSPGIYEPLGVYGDDIVVDVRLTPQVVYLLNSLGFVVNSTKSFQGGSAFRESCGGWFLRGIDVTPLLFRVKGYRGVGTPEHVASTIEGANNALDHGFRFYRSQLIRHVLRVPLKGRKPTKGLNPIRFAKEKGSLVIVSNDPVNLHLTVSYPVTVLSPKEEPSKRLADNLQLDCVLSLELRRKDVVHWYDYRVDGPEPSNDLARHENYLYSRARIHTRPEADDEPVRVLPRVDARRSSFGLGWTPVRN